MEMMRYCPECGHIGPIDNTVHINCCPDGQAALDVPIVLVNELLAARSQAEVLESERNNAMCREHEATEQMRACHEILDRLGAPRNQDNGLNYHLNGRLSRLVANETGQLWAARMGEMEALLRRARGVIPDDYEDEVAVRAAPTPEATVPKTVYLPITNCWRCPECEDFRLHDTPTEKHVYSCHRTDDGRGQSRVIADTSKGEELEIPEWCPLPTSPN